MIVAFANRKAGLYALVAELDRLHRPSAEIAALLGVSIRRINQVRHDLHKEAHTLALPQDLLDSCALFAKRETISEQGLNVCA